MNSKIIIAIVATIIIIVAGLFFFNKGNSNTNINNQNLENRQQVSQNTQTNTESTKPKTYTIDIANFAFSPLELTIKSGDSITWTNQDTAPHTVTSDSGSELSSQELSKSQSYTHTFNNVGTYEYHCTVHPSMKAKIIVQ